MSRHTQSACHVVLRSPDQTRVLARDLLCPANTRSLDPFTSRLRLDGETGTVFLVSSGTGAIVARQRIDDPGRAHTSAGAHLQRITRVQAAVLAPLWDAWDAPTSMLSLQENIVRKRRR